MLNTTNSLIATISLTTNQMNLKFEIGVPPNQRSRYAIIKDFPKSIF